MGGREPLVSHGNQLDFATVGFGHPNIWETYLMNLNDIDSFSEGPSLFGHMRVIRLVKMRRDDDHAIQAQTDVLHAYRQPVVELDPGSHIPSITKHGGM